MTTQPKPLYQRTTTIQQTLFWSNYITVNTDTFSNAYKSAIVAGYKEETAKNITRAKWFLEGNSKYDQLLEKAEENLLEMLSLNENEEIYVKGKGTGKFKINANLLRIKAEMSIFVLTTLGKEKYNKRLSSENLSAPKIEFDPELKKLFLQENPTTFTQ